ncbi:MAG: hypothetical protein KF696_03715 [Planctomycetes bacterium]|nr:hypothetical protein [Planctomycetota bacterium]MCW8134077.1 hypothetical protein [Planctomycetota bacterium]
MKTKLLLTLAATAAFTSFIGVATEQPAHARIKLATLPDKEAVVVRFDHPNVVIVEEERTLTLQKGVNNVDFSWAGTNIDKGSIIFRPVDEKSTTVVLSTSYPPGEAALTWQINATEARSEKFRLSYLMANIQRETDYRAVVSADEKTCTFRHYFKIRNWSGGQFDEADFITRDGKTFEKGLANGEAKRVLVNRWDNVKLVKEYNYDPQRQSEGKILTDYVLKNAKDHGLGAIPLEYGKVRIYQQDSAGTTAFTGEDWGRFTPIGDDMRLNIGIAQDIKVEFKKMVNDIENRRGNVYDTNEVDEYEIKNFKDGEAEVIFTLRVDGEWEMQNSSSGYTSFERIDNETIKFKVKVPGKGEPVKLKFHYKRLNNW